MKCHHGDTEPTETCHGGQTELSPWAYFTRAVRAAQSARGRGEHLTNARSVHSVSLWWICFFFSPWAVPPSLEPDMTSSGFLHEGRAYGLLAAAGLRVPRHGFLESNILPFAPGEPIVLKGVADQLWHKSDRGAVHFGAFDLEALKAEATAMRLRVPEHPWVGGLVCEKVAFKRLSGLPTEALVSLKRDPEAGWLVVCGIGGLQADAWAALAPPMIWPLALTTPEGALAELRAHWLGRTWLGLQRGTEALTDEAKLLAFLQGLWRAVEGLEREGVTLLELNPVVLDTEGLPTALDGVGTLGGSIPATVATPDPAWYRALLSPRNLVIAGVSSREG